MSPIIVVHYSKAKYSVRNVVVNQEDPLDMVEHLWVIYECVVSDKVYVDETEVSLWQQAKEHATSVDKIEGLLNQHKEQTGFMKGL